MIQSYNAGMDIFQVLLLGFYLGVSNVPLMGMKCSAKCSKSTEGISSI